MQYIDGFPMRQLREHSDKEKLYSDLMKFIIKLANHGLIHCDFNEFNIIIINEEARGQYKEDFIVIDFPQCISIGHTEAEFYFQRDVECIRRFFKKKLGYEPKEQKGMVDTDGYGDGYKYAYPDFKRDVERIADLDVQVEASGYSKKKKGDRDLEDAVASMRGGLDDDDIVGESDEEEEEEDYDEDGYDSDEDEEDQDADQDEENERIIKALQDGVESLKMDKLGNYILE
jgi:RIO kinase 2